MMPHLRALLAFGAILLLAACGGGGSNSGGSTTTPPTLTNFTTVTVDDGPAALDTGPNAYIQYDVPYVSVTICAPGSTTNCQTIDHVEVDTGSVGLRIVQSVINASLLSALPTQTDPSGNPVGECYGFVDGYTFGSVRSADFSIGGETVASMPFQVVGDTGAFATVPNSCSSGGGATEDTVQALGANGIIGIGGTVTDCGAYCTTANSASTALYYDCPTSGCGTIIARTSSASAPFQQLPNPVAAFALDNNGTILSLPSVPSAGEATLTGTLYFGIGTQTNNALASTATVLTATGSTSPNGEGLITAVYNGQSLDESYLDSGSNSLFFVDNTITDCSSSTYPGYYCPSSPLTLTATLQGANGASTSPTFPLYNAQSLLNTSYAVLPGLGANPNALTGFSPYSNSFAFGLPFFFGRSVYTAIEGRDAGGTMGPYFAF
jgi:hypothetical protein